MLIKHFRSGTYGLNPLIRIKKRRGVWKTYLVYHAKTDREYEVFLDKYPTLKEAYAVASYIAGAIS